ncbi:DUF2860 family protein [Kaarinaea lacus]
MTKILLLAVLLSSTYSSWVLAFTAIPEESGFSGYLLFGASYAHTSSNMLVGTKATELTPKATDSLTVTPSGQDSLTTTLLGELRYTYARQRTQIFVGQVFTDYIRYDITDLLGVRREFASLGTMGISYVFAGFVTSVWKDPYVVNAERVETDRKQAGWRFSWERIFNTPIALQYTLRRIELDEQSGKTQLGLSDQEAQLLDRNGNLHEWQLYYEWELNRYHSITPELIYDNVETDGRAMATDRFGVKLMYTFVRKELGLVLVTAGSYGSADYKAVNPVYGETRKDQRYGLDFTYMQFGLVKSYQSQLALVTNLYLFSDDVNLDFYDTRLYGITLSFLFRLE